MPFPGKAKDEAYKSGIERSVAIRGAVMFNIVEQSIRNLEHGLVGDILVRPSNAWSDIVGDERRSHSLDTEFDSPEALGQDIRDLLLHRTVRRMCHGHGRHLCARLSPLGDGSGSVVVARSGGGRRERRREVTTRLARLSRLLSQ